MVFRLINISTFAFVMACASKQPVALAPNPTTQEPVLSVPVRAKAVVVDKTIPKDQQLMPL